MVELDPSLDASLPAAVPEPSAYRGYQQWVRPGIFPLTAETAAGLVADYDLAGASVRSFAVQPADTGLGVQVTLAAQRRFEPSETCVMRGGSRESWPAASLHFTFNGVTDMRFDASDRVGAALTYGDAGLVVTIGRGGSLKAACGSVWPNDPLWHESTAGRRGSILPTRRLRGLRRYAVTVGLSPSATSW